MAGDFGVGWGFAEGGDEELRLAAAWANEALLRPWAAVSDARGQFEMNVYSKPPGRERRRMYYIVD